MLPKETQAALIAASVAKAQPEPAAETLPIIAERDAVSASRLTDNQRSVMMARLAFVREIERMSQVTSQQRAILTLVGRAKSGEGCASGVGLSRLLGYAK